MKIQTSYQNSRDEEALSQDIIRLRDAHNLGEQILEIDDRTSDPSGLPTTSSKWFIWMRSDTSPKELRLLLNGIKYKVELTAV